MQFRRAQRGTDELREHDVLPERVVISLPNVDLHTNNSSPSWVLIAFGFNWGTRFTGVHLYYHDYGRVPSYVPVPLYFLTWSYTRYMCRYNLKL